MRLTLRTMLAYLDDILEPDDAQDIGKKIEESEFATNLVHRTRDCMRRLRLGTPALMGRGLGADPNTVAEYLDNTLPAESVPEFEKICLESDMHLAEVASCHQVLTLVLGEPVEVSLESRQRVYQLASHVDAPPVQNDAVRPVSPTTSPATPAPPTIPRRIKPEVPDYLRESRRRTWPMVAATVVVGALLAFGGLMAFGPAEWRARMTALVERNDNPDEADVPPAEVAAASDVPQPEQSKEPTPLKDEPEANSESTESPKEPTDAATETAIVPPTIGTKTEEPDAPVAPEPADESNKAGDLAATPERTMPDDAAADKSVEIGPPGELAKPGSAPKETEEKADQPADGFGRYISKRGEVLLKYDPSAKTWIRLGSMSPLAKGDRLLSLPAFRPAISLSSNLTLQPDGAALVELVDWTEQGVPVVALEYGRMLMLTDGKAGNPLVIRVGEQETQLTFVDAESTAAIEVRHVLPPGKDPESALTPAAVDLYATSGSLRVRENGGSVDIQAPAQLALMTGHAERPTQGDFPKWVTSDALNELERGAVATLEPLLLNDRPVDLVLKELATHRRREVRLLAIRSLDELDIFEACIQALNEKDEKASWPTYYEELRSAVARSPQTAAAVREAFEKLRGADAPKLYRMLWGYTAEDLRNGASADLVEGLSHLDSYDVRVMSIANLVAIAGPGNLGYDASYPAAKLAVPVKKWKEKLRKGEIAPRGAPGAAKAKVSARGQEKSAP